MLRQILHFSITVLGQYRNNIFNTGNFAFGIDLVDGLNSFVGLLVATAQVSFFCYKREIFTIIIMYSSCYKSCRVGD